jgi:transposase InsO family protein
MGTRSKAKSGVGSRGRGGDAREEPGVRALRRYTPDERRQAVEAFEKSGLTQHEFARQWGVSHVTLGGWVRKHRAEGPKGLERLAKGPARRRGKAPLAEVVKQEVGRVQREHPTFGLRRVRDFLVRFRGLRVSTGSVRKVREEEGLSPPPAKRPRRRKSVGPPRRFERAAPGQLWQSDITYVDVPWSKKPLYLAAYLDDHSRYVVSHGLFVHQKGEIVLETLEAGISRYGKPKEVLTDQGRQYFAWRGQSTFQKRLKREGIHHVVARAQHPQTLGKIERLWKTLQDELWSRVVLRDLEDARTRLSHFLLHYNFQRPHQGLDGMVPGDRFFGAQREVREAIEREVEKNELRLALRETPRRPVFLVGQIDGQSVSVHGEGGRVVVQLPDGERREIESRDLGIRPEGAEAVPTSAPEGAPTAPSPGGTPKPAASDPTAPSPADAPTDDQPTDDQPSDRRVDDPDAEGLALSGEQGEGDLEAAGEGGA